MNPNGLLPKDAIRLLRQQRFKLSEMLSEGPSRAQFDAWQHTTNQILLMIFGEGSTNVFAVITLAANAENEWSPLWARTTLTAQKAMLQSCIEILQAMPPDKQVAVQHESIASTTSVGPSKRVFLVHGHNEATRESAARLLEKLGLSVVVLHELPNQGNTIIEKFINYSDVAFAVVLLTADDIGKARSNDAGPAYLRARQNVILELGFFLGKLGRSKVCALYEPGVEMPSDYGGVLFVELDPAGAWRMQLARELRTAGLPVDLNNVV